MGALQPLREAKHRAFLARRFLGRGLRRSVDAGFRVYDQTLPYRFDSEKHRDRYGSYPPACIYCTGKPPSPRTSAPRCRGGSSASGPGTTP